MVDGVLYAVEGNWTSAGLSVTAGPAPSFLGGAAGTMKIVKLTENPAAWIYGSFKSEDKWTSQSLSRGWTPDDVTRAVKEGSSFKAYNLANVGNSAAGYVHPITGKSVVIDDVTNELLHVGGERFLY